MPEPLNHEFVRTVDVIGAAVTNSNHERLGQIEEIVLDKFTGENRYAVLSFGGILGLGDKLFALPWRLLTYDKDKEKFILEVDKEVLQEVPGFNKEHWPTKWDAHWVETIDKLYQ